MEQKHEKLFGTDGIRGTPGIYPLTDGMVFKIGGSIARLLHYKRKGSNLPMKVIIGKDTRLSGYRIESILSDAISSYGVDVLLAGIIPTPGLAFLVKELSADMGIMISASHNEPTDNGIKFFGSGGYKVSPQDEDWIEEIIFNNLIHSFVDLTCQKRGEVSSLEPANSLYLNFLKSILGNLNLEGINICLDCGCGATALFAKKLFEQLKARVISINDSPCGENINKGGAMNPALLKELVVNTGSDIGFAFDGDGDRMILIDNKGDILDGDYILAIIAGYLLKNQRLPKATIVTTVMSNYGLKLAIEKLGGKVIFTNVGDKYVLESMIKNHLNLGGEQSGHIILLDHSPTPDGLLTALKILKILKEQNTSLNELSKCFKKMPQILLNVKVKEKKPFESIPSVWGAICDSNTRLKDNGRLLVRYSGTEPLARIMVEGKDQGLITEIAQSLAARIKGEIGIEPEETGLHA
ncbi:MAG: phosphoglucosamine mutase [Candidatus Omnitrophica bacterium]|nr:phosphoglucosamine mutase [Candidatus Omnitrophota bacterium]